MQTHQAGKKSFSPFSEISGSHTSSEETSPLEREPLQRLMAIHQGSGLKPTTVMHLQRTYGNHFVSNLLRPVTSSTASSGSHNLQRSSLTIQRTPDEDAEAIYTEWHQTSFLSASALALLQANQRAKTQAALLDAAAKLSPELAEVLSGTLHSVKFEDLLGKKQYPVKPNDLRGWQRWKMTGQGNPTHMNCWQGMLYAAFLCNILTRAEVDQLDTKNAVSGTPQIASIGVSIAEANGHRMLRQGAAGGELMFGANLSIRAGDVIFFGSTGGEHIALATGRKRAVEDKKMAKLYERDQGYEMIELDRDNPQQTIVTTTIEDKMGLGGAYSAGLGWASLYAIRQQLQSENAEAEDNGTAE